MSASTEPGNLFYKYAAPTELEIFEDLILQICRSYGARQILVGSWVFDKYFAPTGLSASCDWNSEGGVFAERVTRNKLLKLR